MTHCTEVQVPEGPRDHPSHGDGVRDGLFGSAKSTLPITDPTPRIRRRIRHTPKVEIDVPASSRVVVALLNQSEPLGRVAVRAFGGTRVPGVADITNT